MPMDVFIIFVVSFLLGICFCKLCIKKDGRLVIDGPDYFIAITTKPEDLSKRKNITLKVVSK